MHTAPSTAFQGKICNPAAAAGKHSPSSEQHQLWPQPLRSDRKKETRDSSTLQGSGHSMQLGSAIPFSTTLLLFKKVKIYIYHKSC